MSKLPLLEDFLYKVTLSYTFHALWGANKQENNKFSPKNWKGFSDGLLLKKLITRGNAIMFPQSHPIPRFYILWMGFSHFFAFLRGELWQAITFSVLPQLRRVFPHSCSISSSVIGQRLLSNFACNVTTHTNLTECSFSTTSSCLFSSTSFAGIQCSSSGEGSWWLPVVPSPLVHWILLFSPPSLLLPHPIPPSPLSLLTASTGSVRLFGGSTRRGIVEVFYDGRWGPVCSSRWGSSDARVVCGELGFNRNGASSYTSTG